MVNKRLGVQKIGVTREIESLSDRYTRDWVVASVIYHPDWLVVTRAEQVAFSVLRAHKGYRKSFLTRAHLRNGFTETFKTSFWLPSRVVKKILHECVILSQAGSIVKR